VFVSRKSFLNHLNNVDYVRFSQIKRDWQAIREENESAAKQFPQYCQPMVMPESEYESWDELGNEYYETTRGLKDWGYLTENTRTWETTAAKPQLQLSWEQSLIDELPLEHAVSKGTMQTPGNIMPWHQDKFFTFRRQFPDNPYIIRFLIFLEDWKIGHVLQAGDSIISHWSAGDVITWLPTRYHLSANIGIENKWTVNITGVLKEEFNWPLGQKKYESKS
jgi:hypothetical protein